MWSKKYFGLLFQIRMISVPFELGKVMSSEMLIPVIPLPEKSPVSKGRQLTLTFSQ